MLVLQNSGLTASSSTPSSGARPGRRRSRRPSRTRPDGRSRSQPAARRRTSSCSRRSARFRTKSTASRSARSAPSQQCSLPLSVEGRVAGAVGFSSIRSERTWSPRELHQLKVFGSVFDQVLARQQRDEAMLAASREVQRLKDQLQAENVYLRQEERERLGLARVVGQSAAMRAGDGADPAGGGHRLDGAPARGDRHRQGTVRDADPRARRPPRPRRWCA